jgi:hypothetical protein
MNLIFIDDITEAGSKQIEEEKFTPFQVVCPHCERTITVFGGCFNSCVHQKCGQCGGALNLIPYKLFCSFCKHRIECLSTPTIRRGSERYWRRSVMHFASFLKEQSRKDFESFIAVCIIVFAIIGAFSTFFFVMWFTGKLVFWVTTIAFWILNAIGRI